MNYCYGKGVQKSVLCWEVVPFLEGPLLEAPLYTHAQFLPYLLMPGTMPQDYFDDIVLMEHSLLPCKSSLPVLGEQEGGPD